MSQSFTYRLAIFHQTIEEVVCSKLLFYPVKEDFTVLSICNLRKEEFCLKSYQFYLFAFQIVEYWNLVFSFLFKNYNRTPAKSVQFYL